jgi:hypothetical protein
VVEKLFNELINYLIKLNNLSINYILPKDSNNLGNDKLFEKYYKKI